MDFERSGVASAVNLFSCGEPPARRLPRHYPQTSSEVVFGLSPTRCPFHSYVYQPPCLFCHRCSGYRQGDHLSSFHQAQLSSVSR
ncbi:hypothetical protein IG631_10350 [Alternaria alternata]|nr:hypothetical protein IG631_10350 [Alternaria alternata]